MYKSCIIITDSGGIQEQAPSIGDPVLVRRDATERHEAVEVGTVTMVGTDGARIVAEPVRLLDHKDHYKKCGETRNPYGDGSACTAIIEDLLNAS